MEDRDLRFEIGDWRLEGKEQTGEQKALEELDAPAGAWFAAGEG
jgi:hypothetical protein